MNNTKLNFGMFKNKQDQLLQNHYKSITVPWSILGLDLIGKQLSVQVQIEEGNKTRLQTFTGIVYDVHKAGFRTNISVKKESKGVWVRRVFPIYSPDIKGWALKD